MRLWPSASFVGEPLILNTWRGNASRVGHVGLSSLPVSFGVLTVDTIEQAIERAGSKAGNKGEEAALTALKC